MITTIIANAVKKNDLQTAMKFAAKLPDVYVNFPNAQQFQVNALAKIGAYNTTLGAIEKLVGHNYISVETALALL